MNCITKIFWKWTFWNVFFVSWKVLVFGFGVMRLLSPTYALLLYHFRITPKYYMLTFRTFINVDCNFDSSLLFLESTCSFVSFSLNSKKEVFSFSDNVWFEWDGNTYSNNKINKLELIRSWIPAKRNCKWLAFAINYKILFFSSKTPGFFSYCLMTFMSQELIGEVTKLLSFHNTDWYDI